MATVITHAIVGGTLASLAPQHVPRLKLALALAILAMIPDLDVVGFHYGIAYHDPFGHRGFTHSILFAALVGVVTPSIVFRRISALSRTWFLLAAFAFTATVSHGILDAFTDAGLGTGFFIPFDNTRYFAPWRPLATSPLSISAFINGPALRILANELVWVGTPLVALLFGWHAIRYLFGRPNASR